MAKGDKRFKKVYVEITNVCNLACGFCPMTKRRPQFMKKDDFVNIVSQIKGLTDQIYLHVMGEPLLHPELEGFLDICHSLDMKVNITTNGFLLHGLRDLLLKSPAVKQVNVSLSSFEANPGQMPLEGYIADIAAFALEAQRSTDIVMSLRLWNLDSQSIQGENTLNERIMELLEQHLMLDFKIQERCMSYRTGRLSNNIYVNIASTFEWPDIDHIETNPHVFCNALRDKFAILVDGTVVPCCFDSDGNIGLGNIYDTPIEKIVFSERAERLYTGFTNRQVVEELCQKCGYARKF